MAEAFLKRKLKMNKTLSIILIVLAVLVLAGGVFFFGAMFGRFNAPGFGMMGNYGWNNYSYGPGMPNGSGGYRPGPGMMGNYGGWNGNRFGPGMMGGGRNGYGMGPGMMGNYGWNNGGPSNLTPLTVDQARGAAGKYIRSLNLQGLETGEVMIFDNNGYVVVKETATGMGAFELLVDPVSQVAYPEYGPNMMWNLKYGMMGGRGGMMGGWFSRGTPPSDVPAGMSVTPEQAVTIAQQYLDANLSGATAAKDPVKFYGYYTLDYEKDGKVAGMLSVNGASGQVFLHTWHGVFIEEAE